MIILVVVADTLHFGIVNTVAALITDADILALTVGRDYPVFGILTYGGDVRYLVENCEGIPGFYPSVLFSILDRNISPDWSMNLYTLPDGKLFVAGYDALTKSYDALLALIREEPRAVEDFLDYKQI